MNEYVDLCNGQILARICTLGAQLVSISDVKSGRQYLWRGGEIENNEWNFSAPVLFPICGMLKNDRYTYQGKEYALQNHGFARFKHFRIESKDENSCSLSLRDDKETMEVYPFQFKFSVSFKLCGRSVKIRYCVENCSNNEDLYFSFGSHEGYRCEKTSDQYFIEFEKDEELQRYLLNDGICDNVTERLILSEHYLPISYLELDRCTYVFKSVLSPEVYLCDDRKKRILSVGIDQCDTLAIWSKRDTHFICIEPWNGFPDMQLCSGELSEKYGIIRLAKGETYSAEHQITVFN